MEPGTLIAGRYRIEKSLAEGGMGAVFVAFDEKFDERVALKIAGGVGGALKEFRGRFKREAKIGNRLGQNSGFVRAFDWGELEDGFRLYLAMDLVEDAVPLDLATGTREERLQRLAQAATLVAEAHRNGVIHRDLKEENFLQDPDGTIRLTDFGLGKLTNEEESENVFDSGLTRSGVGMGTPTFMPPEQFEDAKRVGAKADVYALGVMLYYALTGQYPYEGGVHEIVGKQHKVWLASEPAPRPSDEAAGVPPELDRLCMDALALEETERITIEGFLRGLEQAGSAFTITVRKSTAGRAPAPTSADSETKQAIGTEEEDDEDRPGRQTQGRRIFDRITESRKRRRREAAEAKAAREDKKKSKPPRDLKELTPALVTVGGIGVALALLVTGLALILPDDPVTKQGKGGSSHLVVPPKSGDPEGAEREAAEARRRALQALKKKKLADAIEDAERALVEAKRKQPEVEKVGKDATGAGSKADTPKQSPARKAAIEAYDRGIALRSKKDYDQAIGAFKEALDRDPTYSQAMNEIGVSLWYKKDHAQAVIWFQRAAAAGDSWGMLNLGHMYSGDSGVGVDHSKAYRWYSKSAKAGNAVGMRNAGYAYLYGRGVGEDLPKAVALFIDATKKGDDASMFQLGLLYSDGRGVKQDYAKAHELYKQAADKGHPGAMNNLGYLFQNGYGVSRDDAEAAKWYSKGTKAGDSVAVNNLAWMYYSGTGVTKDRKEAAKYYAQGAARGNSDSMVSLGDMHRAGEGGLKSSHVRAETWYRRAAEAGNLTAMYKLGSIASDRDKNHLSAAQWFGQAAKGGHVGAMGALARLYRLGLGVPKSPKTAVKWYRKALESGENRHYKHALDSLLRRNPELR